MATVHPLVGSPLLLMLSLGGRIVSWKASLSTMIGLFAPRRSTVSGAGLVMAVVSWAISLSPRNLWVGWAGCLVRGQTRRNGGGYRCLRIRSVCWTLISGFDPGTQRLVSLLCDMVFVNTQRAMYSAIHMNHMLPRAYIRYLTTSISRLFLIGPPTRSTTFLPRPFNQIYLQFSGGHKLWWRCHANPSEEWGFPEQGGEDTDPSLQSRILSVHQPLCVVYSRVVTGCTAGLDQI